MSYLSIKTISIYLNVLYIFYLSTLSSANDIICVNGKIINGSCICGALFTGHYCELKMYCDGYDRLENNT